MSRRRAVRGALAAAALAAAGCAGLRPPPQGKPSGRAGWLVYQVEALRFEAPAGWRPGGTPEKLTLTAPDDGARVQAWRVEGTFASEADCLARAEEALKGSEQGLERVRRHQTTLAGRRAVVQEADAGGWHGWAEAVCDGPVQYRIFFTGRSPLGPEVLEAYRTLTASARIGGEA